MDKSERQRFVEWAISEGYDVSDDPGVDGLGIPETTDIECWGFVDPVTDSMWVAWQEASKEKERLRELLNQASELMEEAYHQGWNDCFDYDNPDVGMFFGPTNPKDGFGRFLKRLGENQHE